MSYQEIENALYNIERKMWARSDMRTSCAAVAPLRWYIGTGRAPLDFVRKLISTNPRQQTTIAKRLLSLAFGDYDASINSVCQYLSFRRCS